MKIKIFIFLLPLFLLMQQEINAQGIQFEQTTWETILNKASNEGKIIFMDAYAEWCGPCKKMSKDVFTDVKVADYFNANFINVKMDMEKGEGIELAKQYSVRAYPTLLFIDGDGELVHRAVGYHASDAFLDLAGVAQDDMNNLGGMDRQYDEGDRNPDFLYKYAMAKADAMDPNYKNAAMIYLESQQDWNTKKNLEFIFRFADKVDSPLFNYVMNNQSLFENHFGEEKVSRRVLETVSSLLYEEENEEENLERASEIFHQFDPENGELMDLRFRMYFHQIRQNVDDYAEAAIDLYSKYPAENWQELNGAAWDFYGLVDNPDHLQAAVEWAKQSIEMDKNFYNTDTLASLYYKLGEKGKAKKAAKLAIKLAKEAGEDYSSTEELLKDIKSL